MTLFRAFVLWSAIIPLAIANGIVRDTVLSKILGATLARACSGVMLSAIIFAWTVLTIPWVRASQGRTYAAIGAGWLALTIAFEFIFGRLVAKRSWDDLLRAYRFEDGDIWPVVLCVVAISPFIAGMLRRPG